ncbi:Acetyl-CoA acetyltransferase [Planctomycetes bacterium Pla163]|uniref:Acetyl-CoA acetyltransferase n=1 Tax=Rohdeia mirabilis TaxID=2528008 RepID=A0A518CYF5_9BACT|nr:Acetyl-CoA acetyltransferase [Planctomycetes bacterium Pla163]
MTARGPRPTGRPIVVTHALRTPIGRYLGGFASLSAADLGSSLVASLVARAGIDGALVDHLVFGNGRQAGGGPNVARQIAVRAGLGDGTTALTTNMACASGLKAIEQAADAIELGRARIAVAGGVESMSGLPFFLPQMRAGYRLGHAKVVDSMYQDGFQCPLAGMLMGATAEVLAREFEIDRAEQDAFALASQHKCQAAREAGRFTDEIAPVDVVGRKGDVTTIDTDEHPRDDARIESLAKLPAVFDRDNGTVTAGNSSGITDGAAALLVMGADTAEELGLAPLAFIGGSSEAGVEPERMGIGPVPAMAKLEAHNGLTPGDYDLIELNEAFAAQVLACDRMAPLPMDRVNVNGGSIALGHPIGATGARIVVTLLHEMQRRAAQNGLATLCVSGGMGMAMHLSRRGL